MKKKPIQSLRIELKPSKMIKGEIGLFAACYLPKGTIIAQTEKMQEQFVAWHEYNKTNKKTKNKIRDFCIQTQEGFFAPPDLNYLSVPWYMNHCCSYNVGFDKHGNFIAARNIRSGEELTIDYGLAISNPEYKMTCKCKSKNCRKYITGNDWLDKNFMKQNKRYFLRELMEMDKKQIA